MRRLCTVYGVMGLAAAAALPWFDEPTSNPLTAAGRWVLNANGQPAVNDGFLRGLQPSGLAFDGSVLWSVGDQRSAYSGHLFALRPDTGRLVDEPFPLDAIDPEIRGQLSAWGRIDLEGIDVLSVAERRFVLLIEDDETAALAVRLSEPRHVAIVEAIWRFRFPGDAAPRPYHNDANFRLEGLALDPVSGQGYVAFERDHQNRPLFFQFDLRTAPTAGIGQVDLAVLPFHDGKLLGGKPETLLNVNGLEFARSLAHEARLLVLCRDRELFFMMNPSTGRLIAQFELALKSPDGDPIEWVSPEGIALDRRRNIVYVISDPDSTDGNWRLRSTPHATGRFAEFVPLLFELKLPTELFR